MLLKYKRVLFALTAVIFLIISPLIAIYSLGYEINFDDSKIENTLSVKLSTLPRGAKVLINEQDTRTTPIDFRTQVGKSVSLEISKKNFKTESYTIISNENNNYRAKLEPIFLLPTNNIILDTLPTTQKVYFLDSSNLLLVDSNSITILRYNSSGILGNSQVLLESIDTSGIQDDNWYPLSRLSWWSDVNQIYLAKNENGLILIDFKQFGIDFKQIVNNTQDQVLLLDKEDRLWSFSIQESSLRFISSGIQAIAYTPSPGSVWILKDQNIYRLSPGQILNSLLDLNLNDIYLEDLDLNTDSVETFKILSGGQGLSFQINQSLIFSPDNNPQRYIIYASSVLDFIMVKNNIIYIDTRGNLNSVDILLDKSDMLTNMDFENSDYLSLDYNLNWKRIFVYTKSGIYSMHFNSEILNNAEIFYDSSFWLSYSNCSPKIINNTQICINELNQLLNYSNTSII